MSRPSDALSQFVLKVHSRCDLACDHCYVYEAADQSWRGRPVVMSEEVVGRASRRIAEHASARGLEEVQVVLHGGEPLLAGVARLRRVVSELNTALQGVSRLDLRIHTNGVLLNEDFCELFAEYDVRVGISLDGDRVANDRHRRYSDGRSSYDKVIRAVGLLREGRFRDLYAGLLCTIDVANDPLTVYESLMRLHPPRVDFLLPHATWDHPPARTPASDAEYAAWLIEIFERWIADGQPARVRTFDSIIATLSGRESFTEALGLGPVGLVVIETDGSYEQVDSLKAAYGGAPETGMNVFDHPVDVVGRHPGILARQQGLAGLCDTCQACPVVTSCGGGLYTHRHKTGTGFTNPSVYCADLLALIAHIRHRLEQEPAAVADTVTHVISGPGFRALAAGLGDADAVTQLAVAQRSLVRVLLGSVYREAVVSPAVPAAARAEFRNAWSLLTILDRDQPEALNAALSHPYVRAWTVRCLKQLRPSTAWTDDESQSVVTLIADLGHLGAIAAAAAARARVSAVVTVPVVAGAVHLPTLGRLIIGPAESHQPQDEAPAVVTVEPAGPTVAIRRGASCWTLEAADLLGSEGRLVAVAGTGRSASWQPVRMLTAPGIHVALEDTDPYRDCHQWQAAPRLTEAEFARWQRHFQDAWQEIERAHAAYAPALAAGLTTLMPLAPAAAGRDVSAAARHAFGAIAAALPAEPATLALLLIHEFQHVKLGAILDLYDLYDATDDRLFHAPWREDKRPLEGLLQGTYAHLAVADFWRVRQQMSDGPAAEAAGQRYLHWQAHTRDAIETLATSGSLTPLGTSFVDEMRHSV